MDGTTITRDTDLLCSRIIRSIATAIDANPLAMEPLYRAVDVEALARLLESDASVEVEFEYDGHDVVVREGELSVDGTVYES